MSAKSSRPKKPSMADALGTTDTGGLISFFERAALDTRGASTAASLQVQELALDRIDHNPQQARQAFDMSSLEELAASIREHGVIEPIIVRPMDDRYQIVAGERRYRAATIAGQERIPARIMDLDNTQAVLVTALENLQREDLDIEDEARQFAAILEATGMSQRNLARMLGKDHLYVSRRVKLLQRPEMMEEYRSGRMKLHQAVAAVDALEGNSEQTGSQGTNIGAGTGEEGFDLIERDDLTGYVVVRGGEQRIYIGPKSTGEARFRWRPAMQFRNWLGRVKPQDVPAEERATFRAQIAEIKSKLDEWEKALDLDETGKEAQNREAGVTEPPEPQAEEHGQASAESGDGATATREQTEE